MKYAKRIGFVVTVCVVTMIVLAKLNVPVLSDMTKRA